MLSKIKSKSKGWIAYFIVGLITIPFALFGINQYFTGPSNLVVAVVNDETANVKPFSGLRTLQKGYKADTRFYIY